MSDLRVRYRTARGPVDSLRGVSLDVRAGEVLGVVGESGSGKSTLAAAMSGTLPRSAEVTGAVVLAGTDLLTATASRRRALRSSSLGVVGQNPITSMDPTRRVARAFADLGIPHVRAVEALRGVGMGDPERVLRSHPHQLSGGMAQRVAIALATSRDPALMIADEPTSALDAQIADSVLTLLVEQARTRGAALLVVTHDLGVVERFCGRVAVMSHGEVVETGAVHDVLRAPSHPYTRSLLSATATLHGEERPVMPPRGRPVITLNDVSVAFQHGPPWRRSTKLAVDSFSLEIHEGEMVGLVGPSGAGKTTISRLLLGLQRADSGQVLIDGRPLRSPRRGAPGAVQVVLQHPEWALDPTIRVGASIAEPLAVVRGERGRGARSAVLAMMEQLGLEAALADRYPHEISGGQRQRASIARALIAEPKLV
ncbi:MAG: ABC transporter ATP-binding protein, partial [Cellulomonadaceae bacterium]|nr:ABC transporter ATP-binding protein [Cellulomonadaceae bacterium]